MNLTAIACLFILLVSNGHASVVNMREKSAMRLDHFVVHIDNDARLLETLKQEIEPLGYPFQPEAGKGTSGFQAANIWIGKQYFEIIRLLKPHGGDWIADWIPRYNAGERGIFAIYLAVDQLDALTEKLKQKGIAVRGPERLQVKTFFGLLKLSMPWKTLFLPRIPGTPVQINFFEYDPGIESKMDAEMVPNAKTNGILGISAAHLEGLNEAAKEFLYQIFEERWQKQGDLDTIQLDENHKIFLHTGPSERFLVKLKAVSTNPTFVGKKFQLENVELETIAQ